MEEITEEEFICFEGELEQHRIQILNQMDLLEEEYNEVWENIANRREEELRHTCTWNMGWKLALSKKMLTEIVQISVDSKTGAGRRNSY